MQKQVCKSVSCRFCWDWTNVYVIWGSTSMFCGTAKFLCPWQLLRSESPRESRILFESDFQLQGGYVGFQLGGLWFKTDIPKEIATKKTGLTKHNIDELTDDQTHPPHLVASLLLVFFLCQMVIPKPLAHRKKKNANCFNDCLVKMEEPIFSANFAGW